MVISPRFLNMMTQLNISLSEKQLEQFDKYYQLLVEWNKVMNLTGITEYDEVFCKHFADSLSITKATRAIYPVSSRIDRKKNRVTIVGRNPITLPIPLKIPSTTRDCSTVLTPAARSPFPINPITQSTAIVIPSDIHAPR